jgi:hypothetical protein
MTVDYRVELGDVRHVTADLLVLKFAQAFFGADELVADILVSRGVCAREAIVPAPGRVAIIDTSPLGGAIGPKRVAFIGVPSLRDFRYREMRDFARHAIEIAAKEASPVRSLVATVHGAGYGLDVEESLQAMVFGFQLGLAAHKPAALEKIVFVEKNERRVDRLEGALRALGPIHAGGAAPLSLASPAVVAPPSHDKKTAFVAMPFTEEHEDVYEFGIYAPIRRCGYACERVDVATFTGDITSRIKEGINNARFVVADLTGERPNVYLEVGYAWGLGKPVILLARDGQKLHFDLAHHKCIFYKTIGKLSADVERLVRELYGPG